MKKKIFAVLMLALLATACSSKKVIKNTGVGVDSANKYAIEDTEASKKPLEDIIVFDQEGVTIRREGNNLILSMPELILFDFDKYAVKDGIKPSLATLAKALGENKDIHIKIDGYTDFIGTEAYNLELSVKRAIKKRIANSMIINGMTSINKLIVSGTESILSFLALLPIIFCNSSIFSLYCFATSLLKGFSE